MTKLEQLKIDMQNEYQKYNQLYKELCNQKDMINGCLNRIAVSDDEEEVERYYNTLIDRSIKEYREKGRECHRQWLVYEKLFNEYVKEKNDD